jgi:hypothetical protein
LAEREQVIGERGLEFLSGILKTGGHLWGVATEAGGASAPLVREPP